MSDAPRHPAPWKWDDHGEWMALKSADGFDVLVANTEGSEPTPQVQELIRLAPEMAALLRELEWAGDNNEGQAFCPRCQEESSYGLKTHAPDCALAALLARIDGAK